MPVDSMRSRLGLYFRSSASVSWTKSPRISQQMQPFVSSSVFRPRRLIRPPSMPTSPSSFTRTATLPSKSLPSSAFRRNVVLPEPRKPVTRWTRAGLAGCRAITPHAPLSHAAFRRPLQLSAGLARYEPAVSPAPDKLVVPHDHRAAAEGCLRKAVHVHALVGRPVAVRGEFLVIDFLVRLGVDDDHEIGR